MALFGISSVIICCVFMFLLSLFCVCAACHASQRRLLAERKFGSQAKHVAEGLGGVEKRVKGVTKRTNQLDPKTGLAIGDARHETCDACADTDFSGISARVMKPKRGGKNVHKEVKQQVWRPIECRPQTGSLADRRVLSEERSFGSRFCRRRKR